jgi:hypothetical protein
MRNRLGEEPAFMMINGGAGWGEGEPADTRLTRRRHSKEHPFALISYVARTTSDLEKTLLAQNCSASADVAEIVNSKHLTKLQLA